MDKISEMIALIDANGGDAHLIGIQFDNSIFGYFDTEDTKFDRSVNFESHGGIDYVVTFEKAHSKPYGKQDIAMKTYHPVDMVQLLLFIEDEQKRPYLQTERFLSEHF